MRQESEYSTQVEWTAQWTWRPRLHNPRPRRPSGAYSSGRPQQLPAEQIATAASYHCCIQGAVAAAASSLALAASAMSASALACECRKAASVGSHKIALIRLPLQPLTRSFERPCGRLLRQQPLPPSTHTHTDTHRDSHTHTHTHSHAPTRTHTHMQEPHNDEQVEHTYRGASISGM
jgi:hypothetical protein